MSTIKKGDLLKDIPKGELLQDKLPEGEMLVSEGPTGSKLWKKKKKINEDESSDNTLNE